MADIRRAVETDIPAIVSMGRQFHALTAYANVAPLDERVVRDTLTAMMRSTNGDVVFVAGDPPVGMLGAIVTAPWFNRSYRVMQEIFWWVDRDARTQRVGPLLLAALEDWWPRHSDGLLMLRTPNIETKLMDRLYRMKGFVPWDGYYFKAR